MFNTFCYYLNFVHPSIPAALRRAAYAVLPSWDWSYDSPKAGYIGGVDTVLGTVAFYDERGARTFVW
jgi:hypothetical protein